MIKSVELENFKAFGDRVKAPFAPITLIFGENSSGKSSIIQSLNLLKQTRESRETEALLLPRAELGIVDLGSFQDILFDHDIDRTLSIRVEMGVGPGQRRGYLPIPFVRGPSGEILSIELKFKRPSLEAEVILLELNIFGPGQEEPAISFQPTSDVPREVREFTELNFRRRGLRITPRDSRPRYAKCTHVTDNPGFWQRLFERVLRDRTSLEKALATVELRLHRKGNAEDFSDSLFEDISSDHKNKAQVLQAIQEARKFYSKEFGVKDFVGRMLPQSLGTVVGLDGFIPSEVFSNPEFRSPEEIAFVQTRGMVSPILRHYNVGRIAMNVGRAFEQTLESLFPLGPYRRPPERWYIFTGSSPQNVGYKGETLPDLLFRNAQLVDEANEWLSKLDVGYKIGVQSLGASVKDLFEVRLQDTRRKGPVEVGLSDVGFGISQILPFIVQSLASSERIISIEQPEVHIHPRLQADLGDLLAAAIKEPRFNQFIIETHSEHLVLRLQRLVRHKMLSPEDISILFVSRGAKGSNVQRLNIDEDGDFIDDWPGGFFPERLRELI